MKRHSGIFREKCLGWSCYLLFNHLTFTKTECPHVLDVARWVNEIDSWDTGTVQNPPTLARHTALLVTQIRQLYRFAKRNVSFVASKDGDDSAGTVSLSTNHRVLVLAQMSRSQESELALRSSQSEASFPQSLSAIVTR